MKYIKRSSVGIQVVDDTTIELKTALKKFLNNECIKYGSTYDGRITSAKLFLKTKGLVPLFVQRDLILLYTRNIREWDIVLINYNRILCITKESIKSTKVVFDDMEEVLLNVSFNRFMKQVKMVKDIFNRFW